jgi:carbonic anhydrase
MLTLPNKSPNACTCCGDLLRGKFGRRHFLQLAGGAGLFAALAPLSALAATGNYEAMVLACIDPRLQEPVSKYTASRKLTGKYSQFVVAGASIGAMAPAFKDWHKAFWDNLAASIQLHNIKRVIAINHRDCGAAKIAYGAEAVADEAAETNTHRKVLAMFRKEVMERQPTLAVETGLMAINGEIEMYNDFIFVVDAKEKDQQQKSSAKKTNSNN